MTNLDANKLLDEHKNGIKIHPVVEVTKALWLTGDLKGISRKLDTPHTTGLHERMERLRLASGEGA